MENAVASLQLFNLEDKRGIVWIPLQVERIRLKMELDSGSAVSVISH